MTDLTEFEQGILDNIAEHGWQANYVFDPNGEDPGFAYSIGFPESLGTPDVIIFGLPQELMHSMLWEIFRQIKDGKALADGSKWTGLLEGDYTCVSRRVHPDNVGSNYFNSAAWWFRHSGRPREDLSFFQIFWPGVTDRRLPWEEGCHDTVIVAQPMLFEPGHDYE